MSTASQRTCDLKICWSLKKDGNPNRHIGEDFATIETPYFFLWDKTHWSNKSFCFSLATVPCKSIFLKKYTRGHWEEAIIWVSPALLAIMLSEPCPTLRKEFLLLQPFIYCLNVVINISWKHSCRLCLYTFNDRDPFTLQSHSFHLCTLLMNKQFLCVSRQVWSPTISVLWPYF